MVLKSTRNLIVSEVAFRGNLSFLKNVDVRKPYDSCSGIRVGDGSRKNKNSKKYENMENAFPQTIQKVCRRNDVKIIEKHENID